MTGQELHGVVVAGLGRGAELLADELVLDRIEEVFGLRVVPGTLNVRLDASLDAGRSGAKNCAARGADATATRRLAAS